MNNVMIDLQKCIITEKVKKEPVLATIKFNNVKPASTKHRFVNLTNIRVDRESDK